jgi:hypothetical protein
VSQDSQSQGYSLFWSPRVSPYQTIHALSWWCLAIALYNKGSVNILGLAFHTRAVTLYTRFKVCRKREHILQWELPVCFQGHLACVLIVSSASPPPFRELEFGLKLFAAYLWYLSFSVLFFYPATSFRIPNVLSFFSEYRFSWTLFIHKIKMVNPSNLTSYCTSPLFCP